MYVDGLVLLGAESSEATAMTGVLVQLKGLLGKLLTYLPPGKNDRHFADDICRSIFVNEKFCISI